MARTTPVRTKPPELSAATYRLFARVAQDRATGPNRAAGLASKKRYLASAQGARENPMPLNGSMSGVRKFGNRSRWDYTRGPGQKTGAIYGPWYFGKQ